MSPISPEIINAAVVIFTISLAAIVALLVAIRPKGFLEWSILIKATSYLLVMLRSCAVIFFGLDRNNVFGAIAFLFATAATTWFGVCAYATWWKLRYERPSWFQRAPLAFGRWREKYRLF
jgi:hypothetical protein